MTQQKNFDAEELYLAPENTTETVNSVQKTTAVKSAVALTSADATGSSNTMETAYQLPLNTWTEGTIKCPEDEIWYCFTANDASAHEGTNPGWYIIETDSHMDPIGELYEASGILLAEDDDSNAPDFRIRAQLDYGVTYYVKVICFAGITGDFSVRVSGETSSTTPGDSNSSGDTENSECCDTDNNTGGNSNDMSTAYNLPLSTWISGTIECPEDVIWYKFTANASTAHTNQQPGLYIIETDSHMDTIGELYNSAGDLITSGDDSDGGANMDFKLQATLNYGETYYVKVTCFDTVTGSFEIRVNGGTSNYMETAYNLPLSTWVNGTITHADDEIWYKFTANDPEVHPDGEPGWYIIESDSHMDPKGELYEPSGIFVAGDDDSNAPNFRIRAKLNYGETYYVRVTCFADITGDFSIRVAATAFGIDSTGMSSATDLPLSTWVSGTIECPDDELFYKFTANSSTAHTNGEPGWYAIETVSHMDSVGELYDSNGDLVAYNDDSEDGANLDFRIQAQLNYGETYYVRVTCFDTVTGDFAIRVSGDLSNEMETAYILPLSTAVNGTFVCSDDEIWYKFTANDTTVHSEGELGWYIIESDSDMNIGGTLYDSNGNFVASDNDSETFDFRIRAQLNDDELYHLKIYGYDTHIGDYEIFIFGDSNLSASDDDSNGGTPDSILGENYPPFFNQLASYGCLTANDVQCTNDGLYATTKSIADILLDKGITTLLNSDGTKTLNCDKFFDDWYLYAIYKDSAYTYGLFKLREQEDDDQPADNDTPGITISFIAFKTKCMEQCIMNPTEINRCTLNQEINRVVAEKGQEYSKILKTYYKSASAEGPYLIAELYTKHIASFTKNGYINVPSHYVEIYNSYKEYTADPTETNMIFWKAVELVRLPTFINRNNRDAGKIVCDHEKIYIQDPNNLTLYEKYAILATHTANVSFNSFAAEVVYHARFLKNSLKTIESTVEPIFNFSIYTSATRADMSIDESESPGPTPYYDLDGKLVKQQREHHETY